MEKSASTILADLALEAKLFSQKCYRISKELEKGENSPAPPKGKKKIPQAEVINMKNRKRKQLLKKAQ